MGGTGPESGFDPHAVTADGASAGGGSARAFDGSIGPYRVLGKLGEGGFGVVYEAEQGGPERRRVAVKVIKPGMDSAAVVARFEAERRALSVMDHPGVARVFDGGVTEAWQGSRPYFVMELVRGDPITEHCDRQRLGVGERARLFVRVCEAVQHAHAKGVIHRDLKPSNILVAYDPEGRATPKVIDFGIAKALSGSLGAGTVYTERGQLIGTPEYMSPEQAEMSGQDIDTRADLYSLGVVLYELLTGALPFDSRVMRSLPTGEVPRMIRDERAVRPSARLSGESSGPRSRVAEARGTDASALKRVLRRDLDWVVMRCLEKDRERRYPTPAALARELERFLAGEPVEAGPPTWSRRAGTFARRHKVAIGAGAAVAATLVAATGVSVWFGLSERRQRALADEATAAAEVSARQAEGSLAFLRDVLTSIDPDRARGMDTTLVRSLLDDASRRVGASSGGQPLVEAASRETIADAYMGIGRYAEAASHFRGARDVLARERGEGAPGVLELERKLGVALHAAGDLAGARPLLERVRGAVVGDASLRVRADLASLLESEGRWEEAEAAYRGLLGEAERAAGEDAPLTLELRNDLGYLLVETGRLEEARGHLERAIEGFRRSMGEESTPAIRALSNYAGLLRDAGEGEAAVGPTLEVLEICRRVLEPDHPLLLSALNNAAMVRLDLGELDLAEADLRAALEGLRSTLGPDHPRTLATMHNLGYVLQIGGTLEAARPFVLGAAEGRLRVLGPADEDTLISVGNAGALLVERGEGERAMEMYREVAAGSALALGAEHERALTARHNLGWLLRRTGRASEAAEVLGEAHRARARVLGADHPSALRTQHNLVAALLDAGRGAEALGLAEDHLERAERVHGAASEEAAHARGLVARCRGGG